MRGRRFSGWRAATLATVLLWGSIGVLGASPALGAMAEDERIQRESINITGDSQFNPANGVRSGSGTKSDPFVISNWRVSDISIRDTDSYVVIKNNDVTNQLRLNWNGDRTTVVNNNIGDLRVNQNIKRTGDATGGRIAYNTFGIVGQLRHFDGVFEHNLVKGDTSLFGEVFSNQAVQFDGFHGSRFRNNTIYGFVDVKLHGHHHGSGFQEGSHYHGAEAEKEEADAHAMHGPDVDHTKRYHEVFITNNKIFADGMYALRYTDQAHAGDDRTAPSETNPDLNKSHTHFTRVHLVGNKLTGAGLMVDIFNADDERHTGTQTGLVDIRDNVITLERDSNNDDDLFTPKDGISILRAVDAMVHVQGNSITGEAAADRDLLDEQFANDAGILLDDVDKADIHIGANEVRNLLYGVRASRMTNAVHWWIHGLRTEAVTQPVYYDNSVKNHPRREQ